jgi:exodeoxyribonuclease V alpha subunit
VQEEIRGTIERVTFHSEENGFTVLRVRPKGTGTIVTVVGRLSAPAEGEGIVATGAWQDDRTHGRQFRAEAISLVRASGRVQVETFLGSGAIRGVGPSTAKLMYAHFGEKVFEILDTEPHRLRELSGIGPRRVQMIAESWQKQRSLRELMELLAESGIGLERAGRIQKHFGNDAVRVIRENPYRLAREIRGIGFATADALALKLGLPRESIERIRAGVVHALNEASARGHCGLPSDELVAMAGRLLAIDPALIGEGIRLELGAGRLRAGTLDGRDAVFLPRLHEAEATIASGLLRRVANAPPWSSIDPERALAWVEKQTGLSLAPSQRNAVAVVLGSAVSVITGGPGVGKTTIVRSIVRIVEMKQMRVVLAAPTGRAAKRLAESSGKEAKTIHRLLEINAETGDFARDESNPLECDLVVVDEASMIDAPLMASLVRALPPAAALLIVGDVDQLPSVGPGQILADVISSGAVPVVRLVEVFRQAAASRIVTSAHDINEGRIPPLRPPPGGETDFFFVRTSDPELLAARVVDLVSARIPARFGFDPLRDIQVLSPMKRSLTGVEELNRRLQLALNPRAREKSNGIERFGITWFEGDRVMQTVNDYERDVFNGDLGVIASIDREEECVTVRFEEREVEYGYDDLDDLLLAYATTIHKSQGSEYPAVVVVLTRQHSIMLERNLLYTAVTRGKKLVVLAGEEAAVRQAVSTTTARKRWTRLKEWLRDGASATPPRDGRRSPKRLA